MSRFTDSSKRLGLLITALALLVSMSAQSVSAIDPNQRSLINSGISYYNIGNQNLRCSSSYEFTATDGTLEDYVETYGQIAFDIGESYGLPYEAILAQSAHESGWGNSGLTENANNFFGIKATSGWNGSTYTARTWEEVNGQRVEQDALWRAYPTPYDSFDNYAQLITGSSTYESALAYPGDPYGYIQAVWESGYATDSQYVDKVSVTIEAIEDYIAENDLFPPSSEVTPSPTTPTSNPAAASSYCDGGGSVVAQSVIAIAEEELAKNPQEYDSDVMKYTLGRAEPWCADFVSWVFNEAGSPFSGGWAEDWQIPAVLNMQAWFQEGTNGSEYFAVGEKPPQPGDVAIYRSDQVGGQTPDRNSTSHTNIVISVDIEAGTMVTIGGNESDTVKKSTRRIELGASSLVGFGRMN